MNGVLLHPRLSPLAIITITGITGTVSIDANGDRNGDYSILDMNPKTERFEVSASLSAHH